MRTATAARLLIATLTLLTLAMSADRSWAASIGYQSTVLANSPVAFWRLNETSGTTMIDVTGNGHNGTYTFVALGATGAGPLSDAAGTFNGTSSRSVVPDDAAFDLTNFTLEAVIKLVSPAATDLRVLNQQNGGDYWLLHVNSAWKLTAYSSLDTVGVNGVSFGPSLNDGLFHHIALTRDTVNDLFTWYVDGASVGSVTILNNGTYSIASNVMVGAEATPSQFFPGVIDEAVVYDTALTAAQIQANYIAATQLPPVPEPSTFALLGLGAIGLAVKSRRRRAAA